LSAALTNGSTITTSAGAVSLQVFSAGVLTVTCPDNSTYSGTMAMLSACQNSLPGFSEGEGSSGTPDAGYVGHFSMTLDDTPNPMGIPVFDCANH